MATHVNGKGNDIIPSMLKVTPPAATPSTVPASPGHPSELPQQDVLLACADRFFEQVHCLYWLYSSEDFYTRLESTYSGGCSNQQTSSWLCSLHSIVANSAVHEPSPDGLPNGQLVCDSLDAAKSLVSGVCDEADLDSLRALMVLVSDRRTGKPHAGSSRRGSIPSY